MVTKGKQKATFKPRSADSSTKSVHVEATPLNLEKWKREKDEAHARQVEDKRREIHRNPFAPNVAFTRKVQPAPRFNVTLLGLQAWYTETMHCIGTFSAMSQHQENRQEYHQHIITELASLDAAALSRLIAVTEITHSEKYDLEVLIRAVASMQRSMHKLL